MFMSLRASVLLHGALIVLAAGVVAYDPSVDTEQAYSDSISWVVLAGLVTGVVLVLILVALDACCGCGLLGCLGIMGSGASYGSGANPVWNNHVETCPPEHPSNQQYRLRYQWEYAAEGCAGFGSAAEAEANEAGREGHDSLSSGTFQSRADRLTRDGWFANNEQKGQGCKIDRTTGIGGLSGHLVGRQTWIDKGLASWVPADTAQAQTERLQSAAQGDAPVDDPVTGVGIGWLYRPVAPSSVTGPQSEDESFRASDNPTLRRNGFPAAASAPSRGDGKDEDKDSLQSDDVAVPGHGAGAASARGVLAAGVQHLRGIQQTDGHLAGDYGGPFFLLPGLVITYAVTGTIMSPAQQDGARVYLLNHQQTDGGWGLHMHGPSTMFGTVLNYVTMRLLGFGPGDQRMARAHTWIQSHGGAEGLPAWGKLWLCVLGCYEYEGVNAIPPELWLLPRWFPFHPGRMWCHSRMVYLPMSFLFGARCRGPITPLVKALRRELFVGDYASIDWNRCRSTVCPIDLYSPHTLLADCAFDAITVYEAWTCKRVVERDGRATTAFDGATEAPVMTKGPGHIVSRDDEDDDIDGDEDADPLEGATLKTPPRSKVRSASRSRALRSQGKDRHQRPGDARQQSVHGGVAASNDGPVRFDADRETRAASKDPGGDLDAEAQSRQLGSTGNWVRDAGLRWCVQYMHAEDVQTNFVDIGPVNKVMNMLCCWFAGGMRGENPSFQRHLARVPDYLWVAEDGLKMQGYNGSQLWDTAFAAQALADAGPALLGSVDDARAFLVDAYGFVERSQIRCDESHREHWYRHPSLGGWPFSTRDHGWPIADCTSEGLKAALGLHSLAGQVDRMREHAEEEGGDDHVPSPLQLRRAIPRGRLEQAVDLILSYQNGDDGWATYELKRGGDWFELLNPAEVFGDIMVDYSYTELTSACVCALAEFKAVGGGGALYENDGEDEDEHGTPCPMGSPSSYRGKEVDASIERGVSFIRKQQRADGSYYGSWGVCFTYAAWWAVEGLRLGAGNHGHVCALDAPGMQRLCAFLLQQQHEDGGWGESYLSCVMKRYVDSPSTVVQTAWAVLALVGAQCKDTAAVGKAVRFLMRRQRSNGDWPQESVTGIFNRSCGITYANYRNIFPVWALGAYCSRYDGKDIVLVGGVRDRAPLGPPVASLGGQRAKVNGEVSASRSKSGASAAPPVTVTPTRGVRRRTGAGAGTGGGTGGGGTRSRAGSRRRGGK